MDKNNIHELLKLLQFEQEGNIYYKKYPKANVPLRIDTGGDGHIYYEECGLTVGRETTCSFHDPESLVVLQCVDSLLSKEYDPIHLELEPAWKLGHSAKGGYADIWVRTFADNGFNGSDADKESLLIIECKTWGREFNNAWTDTKEDGGQLFSYLQQERSTKFLCLYTADIIDGKIEKEYHLINVQDNEELLANDDSGKSYKDATNNKQLYTVWHDTYQCDYATRGLFEKDITPYRIGKNKYTVSDLKAVDNDTIQKKYNEFALILRQHNVGSHENAFDKLVNLFLAKVVDETNNPDNLSFYWKGAAYDDAFQLQDRLQRLYRDGMKRFLNEDVTYIENSEIEKAFRRFKNDPDATKKTIMECFRALKFFSDNDFSFISVHNKRLFEQNAAILLKAVKMLQDIKLKDSDQNQLLGDLFEGFLNKGVKQSEGQFFTPMPIVRFLVSALPLEELIRQHEDVPKAIDYACGAGHFLTEYAMQIREYAERHRPDIPLKEFYANITGVEKEYRLSKVSKVSAFMYGHDETNIVYTDALIPHRDVKEGTYDVLIANPPYSVKGFLEMLTEEQRKAYTLFADHINIGKNNAIETFFIERAAQLLKAGGVAGIILPVSVLNKDGIYARTREIILRKFDIVALAEFGSGTFGKTGTNTVTLFLRRKETNTPDDEHYLNRVNSWFNHRHQADEVYQDQHLLHEYCSHCKYAWEDYKAFMEGIISEALLANEIFQNYHASFFGNQRNAMKGVCEAAKEIRTRFKSRQATKAYRSLKQENKRQEEQKAFLDFVMAIEKEKLYYFILANSTPNPVVIVKAPSGTDENKKFLGYEWSDSKGNEGIKYLNAGKRKKSNTDEEDGNEDEEDMMQQIRGINGIQTPLFNPLNLTDDEKINTVIRKNFEGKPTDIHKELTEFVSLGRMVDMIDFSHTAFNLEIKTNVTIIKDYESKYPLAKLGDLLAETPQYGANESAIDGNIQTDYRYIRITDIKEDGTLNNDWKTAEQVEERYILNEGDILFARSGATAGKVFYYKTEYGKALYAGYLIRFIFDSNKVLPLYVYTLLSSTAYKNWVSATRGGSAQPNINAQQFASFKIPVPSIKSGIQQQIANECGAVDKECQAARERIEEIKAEMEDSINNIRGESIPLKKILSFSSERIDYSQIETESYISTDNMIQQYQGIEKSKGAPNTNSVIAYQPNDILISNIRPYLKKIWLADKKGGCSPDVLVLRKLKHIDIESQFIYYSLRRDDFFNYIMSDIKGMKMPRGKKNTIENYKITIPSVEEQQTIIETMTGLEKECLSLQATIENSADKKQAILDKYLK